MSHPPDSPDTERSVVAGRGLRGDVPAALRPWVRFTASGEGAAVVTLPPLQSSLGAPGSALTAACAVRCSQGSRRAQPGCGRASGRARRAALGNNADFVPTPLLLF